MFHFDKDVTPLWDFLGLSEDSTIEEVVSSYNALTDEQKRDGHIRVAWKVLRDPFYRDVYRKYQSIHSVNCAGFFVDQYDDELPYHTEFLTTPFDKIVDYVSNHKSNGSPYMVLLTTGSYSPFHKSHLHIMEAAKEAVEKAGFQVAGGYFSPSHDEYVSTKDGGKAAMHVEKRTYMIETVIEGSPWLYVDKWEGYYNRYAINFTDVIARLELYLNRHIPTDCGIKVCYVFGGDNAQFARTFVQSGYAVCVNRNGFGKRFEAVKEELQECQNVFFVEDDRLEWVSSTLARNGHLEFLDEKIQTLYDDLQNERVTYSKDDVFAVRNDLRMAFPLREDDMNRTVSELTSIIVDAFDGAMSIKNINCMEQLKQAELLKQQAKEKTLSLDVFIRGDINFDISRLFELGTIQFQAKRLTHRPNTLPLEQQVETFQAGKYLLIEDDVVSGYTLRKMFEMLPDGVEVTETVILSHLDEENKDRKFYDIVDMRDFVFGTKNSGLVVTIPNGELARVPYVLPYTSPITRASIPMGKELEFSLRVWEFNRAFYERNPRTLGELDDSFITLMTYNGFSQTDDVVDIIDWHIERLK